MIQCLGWPREWVLYNLSAEKRRERRLCVVVVERLLLPPLLVHSHSHGRYIEGYVDAVFGKSGICLADALARRGHG